MARKSATTRSYRNGLKTLKRRNRGKITLEEFERADDRGCGWICLEVSLFTLGWIFVLTIIIGSVLLKHYH